jgi:tetratricopeptide (TPR) repeat protein
VRVDDLLPLLPGWVAELAGWVSQGLGGAGSDATPGAGAGLTAGAPGGSATAPLLDAILAASRPDPTRRWAGSGELGTVGTRVLTPEALEEALARSLRAEAARHEARARTVVELSRALSRADAAAAVDLLLGAGEAAEVASQPHEAREWYRAARSMAIRFGTPRRTEALRREARAARGAGELGIAAARYREAWLEGRREGAWVDAVVAATGRGNVAIDRGAWGRARVWYEAALALARSERIAGEVRPGLSWPLAQNLAIVAREEGRLDDAAEWLRRGGAWAEEAAAADPDDDGRWRLDLAHGWGQVALARGEVALAVARFREALAGPGPADSRIGVKGNLAAALLAGGRTLEAAEVAREAEAEALRHGAVGRLPELYRILARITRARGEGEPFLFLDHARALVRRHGLPMLEEAETLRLWAEFRREDGEEEAADEAVAQAEALAQRVTGALDAVLELEVEMESELELGPELESEVGPGHAPEPPPAPGRRRRHRNQRKDPGGSE